MMAHCMKLSKAACGHMFKHYERAKDEFGQYVKFGNTEIDPARTPNNYNLAPDRGISQGEFVRQRCNEVRCLNRKDVNVMCSWVVTMPKDLEPEKTKDFMQATYDFLENRYGKENVVSAYVHLDEVTPHIHFAFVPVTYDAKKDLYKVAACEVINRTELRVFHGELQDHLEQALGCDVNILTGITQEQGGNKSVSELKKLSKQAELLENEKNRLEAKIGAFKRQIKDRLPTNKEWISFHALYQDFKTMLLDKSESPWSQNFSDFLLVTNDGEKVIIANECEHDCSYQEGDTMYSRYMVSDLDVFDQDHYEDPLMAALEQFDKQYQTQKKAYEQEKKRQECKSLLESLPIEDRCSIVVDTLDTDIELRKYVSSVLDEDHADGIEQLRLEYEEDFDL